LPDPFLRPSFEMNLVEAKESSGKEIINDE
jgi:hypothetical protein